MIKGLPFVPMNHLIFCFVFLVQLNESRKETWSIFHTKNQIRTLGMLVDSDLAFSSHSKSITKVSKRLITCSKKMQWLHLLANQETLIHPFISSRLDYCDGLLTELCQKSIKPLQLIQRIKRTQHITTVLKALRWLPPGD